MEHKKMLFSGGTVHYWISKSKTDNSWLVFLPGLSADHYLFDKQIELIQLFYMGCSGTWLVETL